MNEGQQPKGEPKPLKITINTDGISDEEKQTPKFRRAYQEMLTQLTVPGFAHVLCCHEAAHLFYFTVAGTQDYDSLPAKIVFDPKIDDYGGTSRQSKIHDLLMRAVREQQRLARCIAL